MKRRIILPLGLLLILAAAVVTGLALFGGETHAIQLSATPVSYEVNTEPGVTMTVTRSNRYGADLVILNKTGKDIRSERDFFISLQREKNGEWYPLEYSKEISSTSEFQSNPFPKDEPHEVSYTWTSYYGELPNGQYRIVRVFWEPENAEEPWEGRQFRLAAEFTVE